jgi:hypothetical protein
MVSRWQLCLHIRSCEQQQHCKQQQACLHAGSVLQPQSEPCIRRSGELACLLTCQGQLPICLPSC